jgi:hypothetical protein
VRGSRPARPLVPLLSRVFRPLAVEATAAGIALFDDARRIAAEQFEAVEDILAEGRARREHLDAEAMAAAEKVDEPDEEHAPEEPVSGARTRRTANGGARRRAS